MRNMTPEEEEMFKEVDSMFDEMERRFMRVGQKMRKLVDSGTVQERTRVVVAKQRERQVLSTCILVVLAIVGVVCLVEGIWRQIF